MDTYGSHEGYLYNLHTCSSAEAKRMWKESIKNQWDNQCAYCGSEEEITLDHIVPQTKGGSNHTTNLLACCKKCNGDKGHADWITWYIQQPFFSEERRQSIDDWMFPDDQINHRLYSYKPRRNRAYWLHLCALCIIFNGLISPVPPRPRRTSNSSQYSYRLPHRFPYSHSPLSYHIIIQMSSPLRLYK